MITIITILSISTISILIWTYTQIKKLNHAMKIETELRLELKKYIQSMITDIQSSIEITDRTTHKTIRVIERVSWVRILPPPQTWSTRN